MAAIILDTNIISNAYLPEPPPWLISWLEALPPESVAIPWTLLYETEYGIRLCERHHPGKAAYVLGWFEEFLEQRMVFLDMTVQGARLLGRMAACRSLRNLFETPSLFNWKGERIKSEKIRLGADAMVAAMAIAHQLPIASLNIKDFVHINAFFQIPGLYNPLTDEWVVGPPVGWGLNDAANDDSLATTVAAPGCLHL